MTLYAPSDYWPRATPRPVPFWADAGQWTAPPIGVIEHVQAGDGSPFGTFAGSVAPDRKFSHWWLGKAGEIEQYGPCDYLSWAQGAGNARYYSVETEGEPGEPLTGVQVANFGDLYRWLGLPFTLAEAPGMAGLGTHGMGGVPWGNHPGCPGPIRAAQRPAILAAAQGADMPLTDQDLANIADEVEKRYLVHVGAALETRDQAIGDLVAAVARVEAKLAAGAPVSIPQTFVDGIAAAVVKGLPTQTALTQDDLRTAFAAVLATVHP